MASSSSKGSASHLSIDLSRDRPGHGPLQTRVYFHTVNDQVQFGECVRVVGGHASLGDWNTENSLPLQTSEDAFPCWISADPILVDLHREVEYKYVICGQDGVVRRWEDFVGNRKFIASGPELTIEDDEGLYRLKSAHPEDTEENDEVGNLPIKVRTPLVRKMDKEQKLSFIRALEGDAAITPHDTVFLVAFTLPFKVLRTEGGGFTLEEKAPSDGRNFALLPTVEELRKTKNLKIKLVGWPGIHADNFRERSQLEKLLAEHDCIPVFPPRKEFEDFVSFCSTYLWPVFHDVMLFFQTANPRPFSEQGWAAYQHMNNIYANAVIPLTHESDMIWIQDYHLLMTPTFIARKIHKANIGMFLHTPFPSSDSFKSLPVREELLSGMLSADQIGFQFFAYARNFLVSCKRICGLDPVFRAGGFVGLETNGRNIMVKVAHFVYPFQDSLKVVTSDGVRVKSAEVKALFAGKTVFTCMDRVDGLSGLLPKFRAFKRFLREHPQYRGKVVLVQYCYDSGGGGGEASNNQLVDSLREQADAYLQQDEAGVLRIVQKDGSRGSADASYDIYLRFEKVDREARLALFRAGDILLDTCVKAGLNLMPFEFIAAHHDDSAQHSVSIVSEFSGCSRVLMGAIRINPWNTSELVGACERALTMVEAEKKERFESNLIYASENSPSAWFEDFLADLRRARKKEGIRIENIGFGAKIRQLCVDQDFRKLPSEAVASCYRNAKNRLIFLDNEGTLAADKRHMFREYGAPTKDVSDLKSHGSAPAEHVLQCLRTLCSDSRNTVVILSGRNREMLQEWFSSVPRIGLAAERGFYYMLPIATGDQWHCMVQNPDYNWKTYAFEIMRQFVKRTQGSFIENKGSALVWQYRDADQHFGSWQAKELSSHLKELLFGFDVEVSEGKGYVEVKLRGINKGVAVQKVLSKVTQSFGDVDFVLCIGDDRSDEDMFVAVNAFVDPGEEAHQLETSSQLSTTDGESDSHSDRDHRPIPMPSTPGSRSPDKGGLCSRPSGGKKFGTNLSGSVAGDLRSLGSGLDDPAVCTRRFFTCTVGRKPSAAKFYLDDTEEVSELLATLKSEHDRRASKGDSRHDLTPNSNTWSGGVKRSTPSLSSVDFGVPGSPLRRLHS